jgi:DNA polymerase I - 3''-5'' exonuclease and polymerase domains
VAIVNGDYKHLEWDTAVYQAQDSVAYKELWEDFDIHSDNQKRLGLPTRLVAKTFLFRLIFGGSAPAYANDPEFTHVSTDQQYWQNAIDLFYEKYRGLQLWHESLITEVASNNGILRTPSGRIYKFEMEYKGREWKWPRTKILNYPVQGLGADIMSLGRQVACRRVYRECSRSLFVGTVHDSIMFDCHRDEVQKVGDILYQTWDDLPKLFEKVFGPEYDLPCRIEVGFGPNWKNLTDLERTK